MKTALLVKLFAIAVFILSPFKLQDEPKTKARYESAADDAIAAVEAELPVADWATREKYARSLYAWSYFESSWETNPFRCKPGTEVVNKYGQHRKCLAGGVWEGTNDNGNGCGVVQPHVDTIQKLSNWKGVLEPDWTCKKIRSDRVIGYRAALRILLQLEKDCGSTAAAWSAYAGKLGCLPYVQPEVKKRCKIAGLTELCELPEAG